MLLLLGSQAAGRVSRVLRASQGAGGQPVLQKVRPAASAPRLDLDACATTGPLGHPHEQAEPGSPPLSQRGHQVGREWSHPPPIHFRGRQVRKAAGRRGGWSTLSKVSVSPLVRQSPRDGLSGICVAFLPSDPLGACREPRLAGSWAPGASPPPCPLLFVSIWPDVP